MNREQMKVGCCLLSVCLFSACVTPAKNRFLTAAEIQESIIGNTLAEAETGRSPGSATAWPN
ncbi:MAG: hypothetical protein IIA02_06600 [Proteobacteria bacterium]|nr:hypothetical protein [Pseudomonadota bacterium]